MVALQAQTVVAGQPLLSWDDFVQEYLESRGIAEDAPSPIERGGTTLDYLEEQLNQPLNLNIATRDELLQLSFLSAAQVDSMLNYRARLRAFSSPSDLMMVRGISAQQRRWLSLFTVVGDTLRPAASWTDELRRARHTLELRTLLSLPMAWQFGYNPRHLPDAQHQFLGSPLNTTLRYRLRSQQTWRAGITLDQDAGEPFARCGNYPVDHASFFVAHHAENRQQDWFVGDYHAQLGQGLLVGHRFGTFVQGYFLDLPRQRVRISPNTSADEAHFLRGIAFSQRLSQWQWLVFASFRQEDARLENGSVHTRYTNGLHRQWVELAHRRQLGHFATGAHLAWKKQHTEWGISALWQQFSHPFPTSLGTRGIPLIMMGKSVGGMSVDAAHYARKWSVQGEFAMDHHGGTAFSLFTRRELLKSDVLIFQLRHFSPQYIAPLAQSFQQGSHVQNETGLLLGYETRRWRKLAISAFAQGYHHPLPTWRAAAPSYGWVAQTLLNYMPHRSSNWTLRYRCSSVQQTIPQHAPLLQWVTRQGLRLQFRREYAHFSWQTSCDVSLSHRQLSPRWQRGWMCAARATYRPHQQWHTSLFLSYFSTDSYAARLYAYQPQLPGTGGFPTFFGRGWSGVLLAAWQPQRAWTLAARIALTHRFALPLSSASDTQLLSTSSAPSSASSVVSSHSSEFFGKSSDVLEETSDILGKNFALRLGLWLRYQF